MFSDSFYLQVKDRLYLLLRGWYWRDIRFANISETELLFVAREAIESSIIRRRLPKKRIGGKRVIEVGSICWEEYYHPTKALVLIAVRYDDNSIGFVQYTGTKFLPVGGRYLWTMHDHQKLPVLELKDDLIVAWINNERGIVFRAHDPDNRYSGDALAWRGAAAIRKITEAGFFHTKK